MGQPHDGPTCCLIIARVRFRNPHSHLWTIFPGGPCPPIDMLCKAGQLAGMHETTFENKNPGPAGSCLHDAVIHAHISRVVISDIPISSCSFVTSPGGGDHTGEGQGPGHRLGNDDLV